MKLRALVVGMGLLCSFSSFAATELRYGLEAEYPPFESRNASGELEGFDVELGNAICKAAALKCSWVETSFDALIPGLVAKKFDAINSAMNITEQRRPATEASTLYEETAESVEKREKMAQARKLNALTMPHPDRRPDKKERRNLIKFKYGENE